MSTNNSPQRTVDTGNHAVERINESDDEISPFFAREQKEADDDRTGNRGGTTPPENAEGVALIESLMNNAPVGFVFFDSNLRYRVVNSYLAEMNGIPALEHIGRTVEEIVPTLAPQARRAFREVMETQKPVLDREFSGETPKQPGQLRYWKESWYPVKGPGGSFIGVGAVVVEISEQKQMQEALHDLTGRLLVLQDEARRQLARDLHEHLAQDVTALGLNLDMIKESIGRVGEHEYEAVARCLEIAEQCVSKIRTFSYTLHPPHLDERGLATALQTYVDGFQSRSKIAVALDFRDEIGRLPVNIETTLFRVVQEALTNIYHHAGSSTASIHVRRDSAGVEMIISDSGKGMSEAAAATAVIDSPTNVGVGLPSIRERVRQVGGRMKLSSGPNGTTLEIVIPSPHPS